MTAEVEVLEADRADLKLLGERIRSAVRAAGGNERVSERADIPVRTLNMYMAGAADPKVTKLQRIALACNISLNELVGGFPPEPNAGIGQVIKAADASAAGLVGFVAVPRLNVRAAAGPGQLTVSALDETDNIMMLRESFLRSLGIAPRNAQLLEAVGDSMEPTIRDRDLMLVDRGIDRVIDDGIYVVVVSGLVLVKRLQPRFDGSVVLLSDNNRYQPEVISRDRAPELVVESRVKWVVRSI